MRIIGLCGGSGSGKGTVSHIFSRYNIPHIDTDLVYRELTIPGGGLLNKLILEFGDSILDEFGALNRRALATLVFSDATGALREKLNSITLTEIIRETEKRIEALSKSGYAAVIVDAPLLFESGFDKKCDVIIAVLADKEIRIDRIMKRDGIDKDSAVKRINSQTSDDFLIENSDFVIKNNGSVLDLEPEILVITNKIKDRGAN